MICCDESFSANKNDRSVLIVNLFLTKWNIAIEILEDEEGTTIQTFVEKLCTRMKLIKIGC